MSGCLWAASKMTGIWPPRRASFRLQVRGGAEGTCESISHQTLSLPNRADPIIEIVGVLDLIPNRTDPPPCPENQDTPAGGQGVEENKQQGSTSGPLTYHPATLDASNVVLPWEIESEPRHEIDAARRDEPGELEFAHAWPGYPDGYTPPDKDLRASDDAKNVASFRSKAELREDRVTDLTAFLAGHPRALSYEGLLAALAARWPDITFAEFESASRTAAAILEANIARNQAELERLEAAIGGAA